MATQLKVHRITATANVTTHCTAIRSVILVGGSDTATLALRDGGAGGDLILELKVPANVSLAYPFSPDDLPVDNRTPAQGLHATLTGTGPVAYVYTK